MPSKLDYLSKYLGAEDANDSSSKKKKKKKKRKQEKPNRDYEERVKEYDEDEAANQFPKGDVEEEDDGDIMALPEEDRPTIVDSQDLGAHADSLLPRVRESRGTWNTTATSGSGGFNDETNDESPPTSTRRRRHDSSDDESTNHQQPRRPRKRYDSEDENETSAIADKPANPSPERRPRYDSDEEDEPSASNRRQRRRRYDSDDDQEEKVDQQHRPKRRYDSEDDNEEHRPNTTVTSEESSTRRSKRRYDSEDDEPDDKPKPKASPSPQPRRRHDSDNDEEDSFGRKKRRRYDSEEEDTATKVKTEPDTVRSSGKKRYDSEDEEDDNQSNGGRRQRRKRYDSSDDDGDNGKKRMSSGHKAGLQNYKDFNSAEEKIQQRKHTDAQAMVDKYGMGETVYRDAQGRRTQKPENGQESNEQQQEQMKNLNQGKVQRAEREMQAQEMAILQNSTFARHEADHRLEDMRKNEIRKGDPMAAYAAQQESKKKQKKKKKKSKRSGDVEMEEDEDEKPIYKGPAPKPNRFGIRPGYRWDGVDRGNGWEDKLLAKKFMSKAKEEEAYRWRSSDM